MQNLRKTLIIFLAATLPLAAILLAVGFMAPSPSLAAPTASTSGAATVIQADVPVSDIATGNTTSNSNTSRNVEVGTDGTIYVAYHGTNGVRVARSTDGGQTFLPSVQLDAGDYEVEVTVDLNGDVYAAWSDGTNIFVSRSTDGGATFSPAVNAGTTNSRNTHIDTDAPYVYVVDSGGQNLHVSDDNGQTFTSYATGLPGQVYADVHVNKRNGDVFVLADNPQLYMTRSTDNGQTFETALQPTGAVYHSAYATSFNDTEWYGFVSGNAYSPVNIGTEAYRIDFQLDTSTPITFGLSIPYNSRSLAVDNCGQIVDGYSDNTSLFFATSTDLGDNFGAASTVSTGSDLSVTADPVNGYVVTVYESGGQIYASVYDNGLSACEASGGRPIADNQVVTTTVNLPLPITLTAIDPDDDPLTYTVATSPTHGSLSGLAPDLTYTPDGGYVGSDSFTFQANDGTANSNIATVDITVSPAAAPTVTTDAATAVNTSGATLNGTVNANGNSTAVTFEYGLTDSYGSTATADESPVTGSTATAVSAALSGLTVDTTYHYRVVGQNSGGTTNGADTTFTTSTAPDLEADLAISQSLELYSVIAMTTTITVENLGPDAADGALVTSMLSTNITNVTWTCSATGGAVCSAANGSGGLNETLGAFPSGGTVTYIVSGDLGDWGSVSSTADVVPPAGVSDPDLGNNQSTIGRYSVLLPVIDRDETTMP